MRIVRAIGGEHAAEMPLDMFPVGFRAAALRMLVDATVAQVASVSGCMD